MKKKLLLINSKDKIFIGWDKEKRNLIQLFINNYNYNMEIESLFVKIYSLDKLNTYTEEFKIEDLYQGKVSIPKQYLIQDINIIVSKIVEILLLKINLNKVITPVHAREHSANMESMKHESLLKNQFNNSMSSIKEIDFEN
jgi:hypothetical protein